VAGAQTTASETTGGNVMLTRQQAADELSTHYDPGSVETILGEADEYSQYEDDTVVASTLVTDGRVDGYLIHWL
jgi:hypothetical protein